MNSQKYRISQKTIQDLEDIWKYTFETWSKQQADRYHKLIINEILFMVNNFSSIRPAGHIKRGYRVSKVQSHLIFCKKDGKGVVEVIIIPHQRMQIKSRLNE